MSKNYRLSLVFLVASFFILIIGCSKSKEPTPPGLDSISIIKVGLNYAVVSANIRSTGNATISARGFCWSRNPNPTLSDYSLDIPGSDNSFSETITGLAYNTVYYVRAFATNSVGTAYSQQVEFKTLNTKYTLGQSFQGGKIFYIDSTGEHGLIFPLSYFYEHLPWAAWPYIDETVGTTLPDVGAGKSNTQKILASGNNAANTAAKYCDDLDLNGYSDWFLPSAHELALVKPLIGPLDASGSLFWTSTEATQYKVYLISINAIASFGADTKDFWWGVIPVRAF